MVMMMYRCDTETSSECCEVGVSAKVCDALPDTVDALEDKGSWLVPLQPPIRGQPHHV